MSFIADICLTSPDLMLVHTMRTVPDVSIETIYHAATTASVPSLFYAIQCESVDRERLEDVLADDPSVREATLTETLEERWVYRIELASDQLLVVPRLVELGGAFLHARSADVAWTIEARLPDRETLIEFKSFCDESEIGFELQQLYRTPEADEGDPVGEHGLTVAQREALVTAYELGYFEEPRRASLRDLGEELDVSSTAAGGRLRRGTALLVEELLQPPSERDRT
ncbi:helix-turn-helix domain-containing protein [Natronoglomus mannanivorans]|uniref:Helix-turn-helix domain-containing protein n=1 Tax=Natronoglomus mannanivorans TaxID=2979990 RepID=A0AAP2YY50_9EURY|nr:helix-turn-helix domain-containing protein [Halobacteria archaeon AArc-xg1-1]